jgi:hypothetical protein
VRAATLKAIADFADAAARLARAAAEEDQHEKAVPADALVPLRDLPFDVEARRRLVREGKLKTVRIGRSLFTSRAAVAALATELPPATMPGPKPRAALAPVDDVAEAARRRAARKAAR